MSYNDSDALAHKTGRITILSIMMVILAGMFLAYKTDSCRDKPVVREPCKDEFFQLDSDHKSHQCSPGAKAEYVTTPSPAVICHCGTPGESNNLPDKSHGSQGQTP